MADWVRFVKLPLLARGWMGAAATADFSTPNEDSMAANWIRATKWVSEFVFSGAVRCEMCDRPDRPGGLSHKMCADGHAAVAGGLTESNR